MSIYLPVILSAAKDPTARPAKCIVLDPSLALPTNSPVFHSERSEESSLISADARAAGSFAALRMTRRLVHLLESTDAPALVPVSGRKTGEFISSLGTPGRKVSIPVGSKIMPERVFLLNQRNLPFTQPTLELLLAGDGVADVAKLLKENEQLYGVSLGEAVNLTGPMLPHSALK